MRTLVWIIFLLVASPAFGQQPKAITNSIGMKLVRIHAGSFAMGSPEGERGRQKDETFHEVNISKSYFVALAIAVQESFRSPLVGRAQKQ